MIPEGLLRRVRRIEIKTTRLVDAVFGGEYHSVFKGQGIEFADVREYVPGDDIRTIDWNVTARFQHPFVKKFAEERELTVLFLVDCSGSTHFGSRSKLKSETIAEICALLAFSAGKNNDKVGLITFTDKVERYMVPRKGRSRILQVIREILYPSIEGKGTNLTEALEYLNQVLRRRAIVFLVSDFIAKDFLKPLQLASQKHDVVAIHVKDPLENSMPNVGTVGLEEAETGRLITVNTQNRKWRKEYARLAQQNNESREQVFKTARVDKLEITLGKDPFNPIFRFFKEREKRFR